LTAHHLAHARPHDLGGQPAGPVPLDDHALEAWNNLVTAILYVLGDPGHGLICVHEVRRTIEDMPPDDYRRLDYFDRWAVGLSDLVVEKGLMTRDEIDRRMAALGRAGDGAGEVR
jgi:hypothetical protein